MNIPHIKNAVNSGIISVMIINLMGERIENRGQRTDFSVLCPLSSVICSLSSIFCILSLTGCSTTYSVVTQREEFILIGAEREAKIGQSVSEQVEQKFKVSSDFLLQDKISSIGRRIVDMCDRKELRYHFKVLDEKEPNAFSLPGGYVYINTGLIKETQNDDEIAAVLAHEVGHIAAQHAVKRMQGALSYDLLMALAVFGSRDPKFARGAQFALGQVFVSYSRDDELLSDKLAVKYLKNAGFDPAAMLTLLEKLQDIERKRPPKQINYWRTHPYISDRIRVSREEIYGRIEFEDFINQ